MNFEPRRKREDQVMGELIESRHGEILEITNESTGDVHIMAYPSNALAIIADWASLDFEVTVISAPDPKNPYCMGTFNFRAKTNTPRPRSVERKMELLAQLYGDFSLIPTEYRSTSPNAQPLQETRGDQTGQRPCRRTCSEPSPGKTDERQAP